MAKESERVANVELELERHQADMDELRDSIKTMTEKLSVLALGAIPTNTPPPETRKTRIKPAAPADFDGDRTKGRTFLNSCDLYMSLVSDQFADDSARIYWALSYMKSGRAAAFADRTIRENAPTNAVPYGSWMLFREAFKEEFFVRDEGQAARLKLEGTRYHQGARTVEEYIDEFRDLVDRAGYKEGSIVVLKFRHGLHPEIQRAIATLPASRPHDDQPLEWYATARLCDENRVANDAFQASHRAPKTTTTHPARTASFFPNLARTALAPSAPPTSRLLFAPRPNPPFGKEAEVKPEPRAPDVGSAKGDGKCWRCGELGHFSNNCPHRFDVRHMSSDELEDALQESLAKRDVQEAEEKEEDF